VKVEKEIQKLRDKIILEKEDFDVSLDDLDDPTKLP
jgi:hypothetical protein